jgi:cytoskeletal protein RodZ
LVRDRRGLSTLEFAVLFVVIIVGALALWHALGRSLESQLGRAQSAFDSELAHAEQNSRAAGIERSQAAASGPASGAKPSASPPSAASGPAGGAKPSALPPSAASGPASVAKSSGSPPSAASGPASVAKPSGSPPAPATSGPAAVTRAGGASPGLFDRQLGTGGKIAVAAGGALAGAAVAAGASVLTTYAARRCADRLRWCAPALSPGTSRTRAEKRCTTVAGTS